MNVMTVVEQYCICSLQLHHSSFNRVPGADTATPVFMSKDFKLLDEWHSITHTITNHHAKH